MAKVQLEAVLKLVDVQINPQIFRKISQAVAGLPVSLANTNIQLGKASSNAKALNRNLNKTKQVLSNNERAARLFLQRMAQFAILLPTFATLNRAIQGSVKFLFEFDSALRDIVRIDIGGLSDKMEEVGDAALRTAVEFGVTGTEVLNVTRIFKQAGFTIEESQAKAQAAILATQISTLSSAQAVEVFIAAAKQFGAEGENAVEVLDRLAKVEDLAAVNASDVADAFRTGGNSLAEFSGSIDDSIGLIAALREQSRKSGREIGTFFKTIQTRVFAVGDARSAIEGLGIEVENLDGSLRPTLDVLNDLKMRFDGLTQAQATNAAKSIAGIRQFEGLLATLNSLERANELSAESSKAAGTADEKRLITDAKLERQLGKLVAQGQAFAEALGDAGLEENLAGVLKIATGILKAFTSLADIVGDIGGSLAPLLALGGITLGRSVFGLAKQGAPGGGPGGGKAGGIAPGDKGFVGPLTQAQKQLASFGTQVGRAGTVVKSFVARESARVGLLATSLQISKAQGIQVKTNSATIQSHTAAIKQNIVALKASEAAAIKTRGSPLGGVGGTLLLSLLGTVLPALLGKTAEGLRKFDNAASNTAADILDVSKGGLGLAAQFAVLGPQAAAVAGAFGIVQSSVLKISDSISEEIKARDELRNQIKGQGREITTRAKLTSGTEAGQDFANKLLDALTRGVQDKEQGQDLVRGQKQAFEEIGRALGTSGEEFGKAFLTKAINELDGLDISMPALAKLAPDIQKGEEGIISFIRANQDLIKARAEENDTLNIAEQLIKDVGNGTINASDAFTRLKDVVGGTIPVINEATGIVERMSDTFADLQKRLKIKGFADSIRTLGQQLEIATLGPDALSDSVVRMRTELQLTERESGNTIDRLNEELAGLFGSLDEYTIGLNPAGKSASEFFSIVSGGVRSLDKDAIVEFEKLIDTLPTRQQKAAEQILKIIKAQFDEEFKLQNLRNTLAAETNARSKALLEAEATAAQNAFAATEKFNAELTKFGKSITTDVLSVFQDISLVDVESVLAGQSELDNAVQELIRNAFGDPVTQAQTELQSVTAKTESQLRILAAELSTVEEKLADESNAAQGAALLSQKRALELQLETTKQDGAISATDAKIKVLEAEQEAAENAAEAERKHADLLEKLADASRSFEKELKSVERSFKEFSEQKIADLLGKETDARNDLKDAQQATIETTSSLASAYEGLIKAYFAFNGAIAEAKIKSNLLARDIAMLTGELFTFDGQLSSISNAFRDVLNDSNITLAKRIDLERQLAEETLAFLQQARDSIVQAGLGVFGQTGAENRALGEGIAGLQFIAEQLGGSFEAFLNLTQGELSSVTANLLSLPAEFRQQILDALSFLPSTANIGGFSPEQLRQAIGQVGAGVSPEAGLPSIEELNGQQVEQLTKLQELALQDAQLQFAQVIAAQEQLAAAEEAADAAKLLEERASESLSEVRDAVLEEKVILDLANQERRELLGAVVAADDKNTLLQIEKEAQLFAEQNATFRDIGDNIVRGISSAIGGRLSVIEAAANVNNAARGFIPNFAGGNLTPGEAAALLRAGSREKRAMPGGAGLAVANTSEAIIPMRAGGFIPNFQNGSDIAAGISAIKGINETVVAAIARSVTTALADLQTGGGDTEDLLREIITQLGALNSTSDDISSSNSTVASNTQSSDAGGVTQTGDTQRVEITLQTNQNNTVSVTGLENLRNELEAAVMDTTANQIDEQVSTLFEQLDEILTSLQERGILTSFGQTR